MSRALRELPLQSMDIAKKPYPRGRPLRTKQSGTAEGLYIIRLSSLSN